MDWDDQISAAIGTNGEQSQRESAVSKGVRQQWQAMAAGGCSGRLWRAKMERGDGRRKRQAKAEGSGYGRRRGAAMAGGCGGQSRRAVAAGKSCR